MCAPEGNSEFCFPESLFHNARHRILKIQMNKVNWPLENTNLSCNNSLACVLACSCFACYDLWRQAVFL